MARIRKRPPIFKTSNQLLKRGVGPANFGAQKVTMVNGRGGGGEWCV